MADNLVFQVSNNFNLDTFAQDMVRMGHARGYTTNYANAGGAYYIDFNNGNEGLMKYIGMGANIRLTLMQNGNTLYANFTDADWTGKIVAYLLSGFTCGITLVTGIIGLVKQLDFPKQIGNELFTLLNSNSASYYAPFSQNPFVAHPAPGAYTPPAPPQSQPQPQHFCTTCGAELREGAQFCTQCGSKNTSSI